jgi:D-sedoheptulose 7-phosphate isomerase
MLDRISKSFSQTSKCLENAVDDLSAAILTTAEWMADSLLNDQKVMSCGVGGANSLSQYFCHTMLNSLERERPALPAINLCSESALSTITENPNSSELFSNQVQALGQTGDTLLIIANTEQNVSLHHAIQTAEQRQIKVVLLNCNRERWWDQAPTSNRIEIYTPIASPALAQQLHLLAVQTICELVEFKLFGE